MGEPVNWGDLLRTSPLSPVERCYRDLACNLKFHHEQTSPDSPVHPISSKRESRYLGCKPLSSMYVRNLAGVVEEGQERKLSGIGKVGVGDSCA